MKLINDNIDTDEDLQFLECDADFGDENLKQDNHSSKMCAWDDEIDGNNNDENFYAE